MIIWLSSYTAAQAVHKKQLQQAVTAGSLRPSVLTLVSSQQVEHSLQENQGRLKS